MAVKQFNTRVKLKYDGHDNWKPASGEGLVLLQGEFAFDSTKNNFFIGDGTTGTKSLPYIIGAAVMADYTALGSGVAATPITNSMTLNQALANLQGQVSAAVAGGVTDVTVDSSSVVTNNVAAIVTTGSYDATSNAIATASYVDGKIDALDTQSTVQAITVTDATSSSGAIITMKGVDEVDGIISQGTGTATLAFAKIATSGDAQDLSNLASVAVTSITGDTWITPDVSVGDVTITHAAVTASNAADTNTINGGTGASDTFTTVAPIVDTAGHVTGVTTTTHTITFPSAADLGLTSAMHFIGQATVAADANNFPAVSGHTGNYAAGDVVIGYNTDKNEYIFDGTNWIVLGDEGSYALKNTTITASNCLSSTAKLDGTGAITHDVSGVTSGTYASNASTSVANGGSFNIPQITVDTYGHITGASDVTISLASMQVNNGALMMGVDSASVGTVNVFYANDNTDKSLIIEGSDGISTDISQENSKTVVKIAHGASVSTGSIASPSALKIAYDDYGHVTSSASLTASDITIADSDGHYTASTVEGALEEIAEWDLILNCGTASLVTHTA